MSHDLKQLELDIDELIDLVNISLPYSSQIETLTRYSDSIRFNWRGDSFRVSRYLGVEEAKNGMLYGSTTAILLESLLQLNYSLAFEDAQ